MLCLASRQIATDYAHEFAQMFAGRFGTSKTSRTPYLRVQVGAAHVEVSFPPENGVAKHVLQRLGAPKQSIHFMTFSYTADAMIAKARAACRYGACSRATTRAAAAPISTG